ncbi:MAG: hypothetical protein AAGG72_07120, partial [Pseudomonadota bacterium]
WCRARVDQILENRVDLAVAAVRKESSWAALLSSLADKDQAQKLATEVAERVYRSPAMTSALEQVAVGVGEEVGERIGFASEDAAAPAALCMQAFLGNRYGTAIASAVSASASDDLQKSRDAGGANINTGTVLQQSTGGIAGIAVLLIRRQLANIARSVGQRLVGSVLARLVSVVAGGVGVVLIAKDIWDLRYGVLPIIATEMKSAATKETVRTELATTMRRQFEAQVAGIATATAQQVLQIWRNFKADHSKTLDLADTNTEFRRYLNRLRGDQLARLDEAVGIVAAKEGTPAVIRRLNDGSLDEAVTRLPQAGFQIAREQRSLAVALGWAAIAPSRLDEVVDLGLHRIAQPTNFTKQDIERLLGLQDRIAIQRLAKLPATMRETIFELPIEQRRSLARGLDETELATLAGYLTGLQSTPRKTVLDAVAANPGKMQLLASDNVRQAIVASADQSAAVKMMLRDQQLVDVAAITNDFKLILDGRISPSLALTKHPVVIGVFAFVLLLLFLMMRRLVAAPRSRQAQNHNARSLKARSRFNNATLARGLSEDTNLANDATSAVSSQPAKSAPVKSA